MDLLKTVLIIRTLWWTCDKRSVLSCWGFIQWYCRLPRSCNLLHSRIATSGDLCGLHKTNGIENEIIPSSSPRYNNSCSPALWHVRAQLREAVLVWLAHIFSNNLLRTAVKYCCNFLALKCEAMEVVFFVVTGYFIIIFIWVQTISENVNYNLF